VVDDDPYQGLKLDLLDLLGVTDERVFGVLTDFQVGQMVRAHVHGLKVDAEKFSDALAHKVQRSKGCKVCFYTGFEMSFGGFGRRLDPSRECSYCEAGQQNERDPLEKHMECDNGCGVTLHRDSIDSTEDRWRCTKCREITWTEDKP